MVIFHCYVSSPEGTIKLYDHISLYNHQWHGSWASQDVNCSEVGKIITKHHMAKRKTEAGWSGWDVHKKHPLLSEINGANPRLNKNHIESKVMMSNGFALFGQCHAMLSLLSFKPRLDALPRHQGCRKHHADVHNVHDDTTIVLSCTWVVEDPGFNGSHPKKSM